MHISNHMAVYLSNNTFLSFSLMLIGLWGQSEDGDYHVSIAQLANHTSLRVHEKKGMGEDNFTGRISHVYYKSRMFIIDAFQSMLCMCIQPLQLYSLNSQSS